MSSTLEPLPFVITTNWEFWYFHTMFIGNGQKQIGSCSHSLCITLIRIGVSSFLINKLKMAFENPLHSATPCFPEILFHTVPSHTYLEGKVCEWSIKYSSFCKRYVGKTNPTLHWMFYCDLQQANSYQLIRLLNHLSYVHVLHPPSLHSSSSCEWNFLCHVIYL